MKKIIGITIIATIYLAILVGICMVLSPPWWLGLAWLGGSTIVGGMLILAIKWIQG